MRPSDVKILWADYGKFQAATGWRPEIPFEKTMEDLLDYWRKRVYKKRALRAGPEAPGSYRAPSLRTALSSLGQIMKGTGNAKVFPVPFVILAWAESCSIIPEHQPIAQEVYVAREIKFGTDGWRAIIADDYTFENVRICAQAIANYFKETGEAGKGMVIGYDTRFASENFAAAVAEVLGANGIKVWLCQEAAPTPVVSYAILNQKAAGGVMITASHNPGIWNGLKLRADYAGAAGPEVIARVEDEIRRVQGGSEVKQRDIQELVGAGLVEYLDPKPAYFEQVTPPGGPGRHQERGAEGRRRRDVRRWRRLLRDAAARRLHHRHEHPIPPQPHLPRHQSRTDSTQHR